MEVSHCSNFCSETVKILVDGKEYTEHLCDFTLNSPVFEAMLQPNCFKEGIERKISLPEKTGRQYEILKMALSPQKNLSELMNLTFDDCLVLLGLIEEYQLNPAINEFSQQTISNQKTSTDLLLLAHQYNLEKAFHLHLQ
eukprot:Awhi_evm1s12323